MKNGWWTCPECRLMFNERLAKEAHVRWHIMLLAQEWGDLLAKQGAVDRAMERWRKHL